MSKLLVALCFTLPLASQTSAPLDPKEMVRRAMASYIHDDAAQRQYTYLQRNDVRMLDGSGKLKSHELQTWDITPLEGSPYKRLVKRNDQPLPAAEEQQQQANLQHSIEERRNETPEQRRQRIADSEHKREERFRFLTEVPDAFDFRLTGDEDIDGVSTWVIEGMPRPGFKPKSRESAFFVKMKGRIWVAKSDYHSVKMDCITLDTISIGAFLLRFSPGGHVVVEFAHVNNEVWLPKLVTIQGSARLLFVKGYRMDANYTFTNYRKFATESRVVDVGIR